MASIETIDLTQIHTLLDAKPTAERQAKSDTIKSMLDEVGMTDDELYDVVSAFFGKGEVQDVTNQIVHLSNDYGVQTSISMRKMMNGMEEDMFDAMAEKLILKAAQKLMDKSERNRNEWLAEKSHKLKQMWQLEDDEEALLECLQDYLLSQLDEHVKLSQDAGMLAALRDNRIDMQLTLAALMEAEVTAKMRHIHKEVEVATSGEGRQSFSFLGKVRNTVQGMLGLNKKDDGAFGREHEFSNQMGAGSHQEHGAKAVQVETEMHVQQITQQTVKSVILADVIGDKKRFVDEMKAKRPRHAKKMQGMLDKLEKQITQLEAKGIDADTVGKLNNDKALQVSLGEDGKFRLEGDDKILENDSYVMRRLQGLSDMIANMLKKDAGEVTDGKSLAEDQHDRATEEPATGVKAMMEMVVAKVMQGIEGTKQSLVINDIIGDKAAHELTKLLQEKRLSIEEVNKFLKDTGMFVESVGIDKNGKLNITLSNDAFAKDIMNWLDGAELLGPLKDKHEDDLDKLREGPIEEHEVEQFVYKLVAKMESAMTNKRLELLDLMNDLKAAKQKDFNEIMNKDGTSVADALSSMNEKLASMPKDMKSINEQSRQEQALQNPDQAANLPDKGNIKQR